MLNKAQISIFIVIAAILTIIFVFVATSGSILKDGSLDYDTKITETSVSLAKDSLDHCVESIAKESISEVAFQGGYYIGDDVDHLDQLGLNFPFYVKENSNMVPSITRIEEEMAIHFRNNIGECISFIESDTTSLEVFGESLIVDFDINAQNVVVDLDLPVRVTGQNEEKTFRTFYTIIPFNFQEKYDIANEIVSQQLKVGEYLPMGVLGSLALENNFQYSVKKLDDNNFIYSLQYFEGVGLDEDFTYNFAVSFGGIE